MDFLDSVVKSSNAIIKEKLNNPFGKQAESATTESAQSSSTNVAAPTGPAPADLSGASNSANQDQQQASSNADLEDENATSNSADKFAAIAADAEAVRKNAVKGAKNIGSFLFSMANKAGQTVTQTAKQVKQAVESTSILTDFTKEQQEFIREHGGSMQAGDLPWSSQSEPQSQEIREQILSLSQDKRNFVRNPPSEANFEFEPQKCYPIALSLLKEDPNLGKMRFELVPKLVNEDTFWRNYFYRVSMLKQQIISTTTSASSGSQQGQPATPTNKLAQTDWSSSRSSSGEGPDEITNTEDAIHLAGNIANSTFSSSIDQTPASGFSVEDTRNSLAKAPDANQATSDFFVDDNDLKNKLKELNIGSLDDGNDYGQDG